MASRSAFFASLQEEIDGLKKAGTYKTLTHLASPMAARAHMEEAGELLILSSNNYLGLANEKAVVDAGKKALDHYGAGTASVRFICGTFSIHRELEKDLAAFLSAEAALTYVSCWNANEGVIPLLAGDDGAVISDELNHASIIDACRLVKKSVTKKVYAHSDMASLEACLKETQDARIRVIITDGVFSMEGDIARLPDIVELARRYDAIVVVDDSHATGVLGATGRGTAEYYNMCGDVDVTTSTLGKALGGAAGGFVAAPQTVIEMCIQKSRPQLFSNALPPTVAASARAALNILKNEPERVTRLKEKTAYMRAALRDVGFSPLDGDSAIIPIIVGETAFAISFSRALRDHGIFVTGFGFPVVPEGTARVRCQISDALSYQDLDYARDAFVTVGKKLGVIT